MGEKFIENMARVISDGIIILNSSNDVIYVNDYIKEALKIKINSINDIKIKYYKENNNKIILSLYEKDYEIRGNSLEIDESSYNYKELIVVNNIKEIKNKKNHVIDSIIGESEAIVDIKNKIKKISNSNSSVLITGDSGTGKEVVARAIHEDGNRRDKPFIAINCAAIPESLLESELFGYVKGAFSGASISGRIGKFELANEGIIFLDEIGDMPLPLQVKILRVLQERKISKIGSNEMIDLDIRVIAATNKNIHNLIKENLFREDLYYRINVIPIEIPDLKERKEDIKPLLLSFINNYCREYNLKEIKIKEDVITELEKYIWKGNIRELQNSVEFMINLLDEDNEITIDLLPDYIKEFNSIEKDIQIKDIVKDEVITLEELEKKYINYALEKYGRDTKGKSKAAKKLGIGLATLYRKS
ncbi:sigma 54-interacting transcriptional regulator [Clostridium sp.]|uniref:sigma-54 interaction domain-containing protein n=1 Tax=Clostridium sp. TaxID=1506 RepID=UPI0026135999|nr:sigma 54-interacting transcriptional regulator [Clostridium sp.]